MMQNPLVAHARTPMAAPETPLLRRLRLTWLVLCAALAIGAGGIEYWTEWAGLWVSALVLAVLLATPLVGFVYFRAKNRADEAWAARSDEP
jgi:hypothetical protein